MENLKKLRENNNLTQQQMADILNIQRPTYTRYETGERQPDFELLIRIAQHFNVSIDYLLGNEAKLPEKDTSSLSDKIIEVFNRLDEEKQNTVLAYAEFLASQNNQEK